MANEVDAVATRSNRYKVILIAILFLSPIVLAVYLKSTGWRPAKTKNYGELVIPARPLADVAFTTADGREIRLSQFKHKWLMVTFAADGCTGACENNIYKMRQVHIAQGKHQKRIRRLLVLPANGKQALSLKQKGYPNLVVVTGPAGSIRDFANQVKSADQTAAESTNRIYLIDPLNNLIMSYPQDADAGGIRKDLARLLRVSQIG